MMLASPYVGEKRKSPRKLKNSKTHIYIYIYIYIYLFDG